MSGRVLRAGLSRELRVHCPACDRENRSGLSRASMARDGSARGLVAVALLTGLLGGAGPLEAGHPEETRRSFDDWLATCRKSEASCSIDTFVHDRGGHGGISAQLRVTRPQPGAPVEIVFTPVLRFLAPDSVLDVQVDRENWVSLRPGSGYARAGALNDYGITYGITDRLVIEALVPSLRRGARVTFLFRDDAGTEARYTFSLRGFTTALAFTDHAGSQRAEGPSRDPDAPAPATLLCRGNEPFWSLSVRDRTATYRGFGQRNEERSVLTGALRSFPYFQPPLFVWRGRAAEAAGDLVALITGERCQDTMSDEGGGGTMPYTARLSMPGAEVLIGCCREETAPLMPTLAPEDVPVANLVAKPTDDWAGLVLDLLPAIEACLARTTGTAARVSKAWPMNRGMVGVRTESDTGRWECIASGDGGAVYSVAGLGTAPPVPGEGRTIFTPAGTSPLQGHCWTHERVLAADGHLVGWLSYDGC